MRIVFVCGSLEMGKDGVGDYTLKLSSESNRLGHKVLLIALHDKYITDYKPETSFDNENLNIQLIRLPATFSLQERINITHAFINAYNPDWISLQYVPYSFNNKGLPFAMVNKLKELAPNRRWHIMFHEIWIGFTIISPLKHRIVGFIQKQLAKRLVKNTNPALITTSNALYQQVLERAKIKANVLPLFSNIPVALKEQAFTQQVLHSLGITNECIASYTFIGIFGSLYPEAKIEKTITQELQEAQSQGKKLVFISIGRIGKHGHEEVERLKQRFGNEVKFLITGELNMSQVSQVLQLLDKGISCTPGQHAGKSGVFAVMRLHHLPVLFPVFDTIPEFDEIIRRNHQQLMRKPPHEWSVEHIAQSFTKLLYSN